MRKLVYAINLSIDGVVDHDKLSGSDDVLDYHAELIKSADTFLYGRITWELMVPFWPDVAKKRSGHTKAMNEFAETFDAAKRIIVFSKTADSKQDERTKIVRSGLKEEVLKLKQEDGKNILIGGVDLASQLIQLGLVDEYRFVVQPTVIGEGRRLAKGLQEKLQLKFEDTKALKSGCVALRYVKS